MKTWHHYKVDMTVCLSGNMLSACPSFLCYVCTGTNTDELISWIVFFFCSFHEEGRSLFVDCMYVCILVCTFLACLLRLVNIPAVIVLFTVGISRCVHDSLCVCHHLSDFRRSWNFDFQVCQSLNTRASHSNLKIYLTSLWSSIIIFWFRRSLEVP
jgi:hypothetical protein